MHAYNIVFIKVIMNCFFSDVLRFPGDFSLKRDLKFYFTSFIYIDSLTESPAIKSVYITDCVACVESLTTEQGLEKTHKTTISRTILTSCRYL